LTGREYRVGGDDAEEFLDQVTSDAVELDVSFGFSFRACST
jgi:hypothetical protein